MLEQLGPTPDHRPPTPEPRPLNPLKPYALSFNYFGQRRALTDTEKK
jgi:hypothetical protein